VLPAQARKQEQALFDLRQPRRIGPDAARVPAEVAGDVIDRGRGVGQPLDLRCQRRVQRRQRF